MPVVTTDPNLKSGIEIHAEFADQIEFDSLKTTEGDEVVLADDGKRGRTVNGDNSNFASGNISISVGGRCQNVSIINSRVSINGKDVAGQINQGAQPAITLILNVKSPVGFPARLKGVGDTWFSPRTGPTAPGLLTALHPFFDSILLSTSRASAICETLAISS